MISLNNSDILAFKLMGDYAHYSHPATNYSSLTYPIPPKTTIMGFLGAIIGLDDYSELNRIKYSVSINKNIEKKEFVFNGLQKVLDSGLKLKEGYQNARGKKQFKRELLVAPEYDIFVDLSMISDDIKIMLFDYIKKHKTKYQIYMGINAFEADFSHIEIEAFEKVDDEEVIVNTLISLDKYIYDLKVFNHVSNIRFATEVNTKIRTFSKFKDFIVDISGKQEIKTKNNGFIYKINEKEVCFV